MYITHHHKKRPYFPHNDALKGNFKHRQNRGEVAWPDIPEDFDEWTPPKKRRT